MKTKNRALEERVMKCAASFISDYGVRGWNMNDLAAAAGITKRTLYKIISTKEELVREIVFSNIHESREEFFAKLNAEPDYEGYINLIAETIPEFLKNSYINRYRDILNEYPEIEREIVLEREKAFSRMREFFQRGIDRGYLRSDSSPDQIQQMLQAILIYFVKYSESQEQATVKIRLALKYMLHGCVNPGLRQ